MNVMRNIVLINTARCPQDRILDRLHLKIASNQTKKIDFKLTSSFVHLTPKAFLPDPRLLAEDTNALGVAISGTLDLITADLVPAAEDDVDDDATDSLDEVPTPAPPVVFDIPPAEDAEGTVDPAAPLPVVPLLPAVDLEGP